MIVACKLIKLAPMDSDQPPPLPAEVRELFGLTPPQLVDAVVTEDGTYRTGDGRALVDRADFLREGYALLRAAR